VLALTRVVQRWLDKALLPTTTLDAGIRNSITTSAGYLGFFVAAALGLSYLGLGLEKIAIVAGALSVGIGFGLQSIVNNFVSGLILLWERPIRVGDLVVVADHEGVVRRISVRATEIETLDRSTVIVPNSNLISGVVRNRVRGDRSGRLVLPVSVLRDRDPTRVADLLAACVARHPDVEREPPPRVIFRKIADANLDFDVIVVVKDVTAQLRVQSELNFALFSTMTAENLLAPLGPNTMVVNEVGGTPAALLAIAEALGARGTQERGSGGVNPVPTSVDGSKAKPVPSP
jgi:small-conductance mechanosensitive channel